MNSIFSDWYKAHQNEINALKEQLRPVARAASGEEHYESFWNRVRSIKASSGVVREVAKQLGMIEAD